MKGKTRVLVTHQLQYVQTGAFDHVVVLNDGGICEQGTYAELMARQGELHRLMHAMSANASDVGPTATVAAASEEAAIGSNDSSASSASASTDDSHVASAALSSATAASAETKPIVNGDDILNASAASAAAITTEPAKPKKTAALMTAEERQTGSVSFEVRNAAASSPVRPIDSAPASHLTRRLSILVCLFCRSQIYLYYLTSLASALLPVLIAVSISASRTLKSESAECRFHFCHAHLSATFARTSMLSLAEGIKVVSDWWLSAWTGNLYAQSVTFYLVVYGALGVGQVVLTLIATLCLAFVSQRAALFMHDRAFRNLMRAPLSFFDTTPIGRILNRFSRDQVRFGMNDANVSLFLRCIACVLHLSVVDCCIVRFSARIINHTEEVIDPTSHARRTLSIRRCPTRCERR